LFELQEKLAYKELLAAQLYLNLGNYMGNNYESAVVTAQEAMKSYPFSIYLEEYQITILRARYEFALRSTLQTQPERYRMVVDEYFNYTNTFPNGKYIAEADSYYKEAQSKIDVLPTT
jgi:outer membrane protein assembly factor BamD